MSRRAVPMLHVPDIEAAARWYERIGFEVVDLGSDGHEVIFGLIRFGGSEVMLNGGGRASDAERREVDLYLYVEDVDALFAEVRGWAEVVEPPHDTFYGMREFIIRDLNRFWITFGQAA